MMKSAIVLTLAAFALVACSNDGGGNQAQNPPPKKVERPPTPDNRSQPAEPDPQPEADPAQVTAILATSWSNVKYAFCSAQGAYGVLIDFQGMDLSTSKAGVVKLGVRGCSGTKPFAWRELSQFSSSVKDQTLTLDFGDSLSPPNCYGCGHDTIEVGVDLGEYSQSYGVMGGNSGPCVFLQNKATGGDLFSRFFTCK